MPQQPLDDPKETLFNLRGLRNYYLAVISDHEERVEAAAQKIANAKKELEKVLSDRDKAPKDLKEVDRRIIIAEAEANTKEETIKIDPKLKRLIVMRKKLRELEQELELDG